MPPADLRAHVLAALDQVLDPCSIGRGVPAGLASMGLVVDCAVDGGRVVVALRLTSPACTFQLTFDQQVRALVGALDGVDEVEIEWSDRFDWTDDDLSPAIKERLAEKRAGLLAVVQR